MGTLMVREETAVFGIFVGNNAAGSEKLHRIVRCGRAEAECNFFVSATDFGALAERTREIAEDVTHHADLALCAEESALIEGPVLLCLVLPYVLWYLSCCTVTIAKRRMNNYKEVGTGNRLMLHDRSGA